MTQGPGTVPQALLSQLLSAANHIQPMTHRVSLKMASSFWPNLTRSEAKTLVLNYNFLAGANQQDVGDD